MQLWTVFDGKLYLEESKLGPPYEISTIDQINNWADGIQLLMKNKEFPKRLQFWTRSKSDVLELCRFNNERIDL